MARQSRVVIAVLLVSLLAGCKAAAETYSHAGIATASSGALAAVVSRQSQASILKVWQTWPESGDDL